MSKLVEFKRDSSTVFLPIVVIIGLGLLSLFVFRSRIDFKVVLVLCSFVTIIYLLQIVSSPTRIVLDEEDMTVSIYESFKSKPTILPLSEISISFQKEIRARGRKIKVFRLIYKDRGMLELLPEQAGWREGTLTAICDKISELRSKYG